MKRKTSLGPANEGGRYKHNVAMEIRASQLVNKLAGTYANLDEWSGWAAHFYNDDEVVPYDLTTDQWRRTWAGWLAREIETHDEYLEGKRDYYDLPLPTSGFIWPKPEESTCFACYKKYTRKRKLERMTSGGTIWSIPMHCPECLEIANSGKKEPLPVAKVIKRR